MSVSNSEQIHSAGTKTNKLPFGIKVGYSMGSFGEGLAYNLFIVYFMMFMTNYAGVDPAIAGTISLIAVLWDAITDPIIGQMSDNSKNPKGKRRPFITKSCILLGITTCLLFFNPGFTGMALAGYFLVVNMAFWLLYTASDIPYVILGGEITDNPEERVSLRGIASMVRSLGMFMGLSGSIWIASRLEVNFTDNPSMAWTVTAAIMGLLVTAGYLICVAFTKNYEPPNTPEAQAAQAATVEKNIFKSMWASMKIKPYRNLWFYGVISMISMGLPGSGIFYALSYDGGLSGDQIGFCFTLYTLVMAALSPVCAYLANKIGKKSAMLGFVGFFAISLVGFYFWGFSYTSGLVYFCVYPISMFAFFIIGYTMVYDIGNVSPLKTGIKNEGILFSVFQFAYKLGTAIAMQIAGLLLKFYGYDAELAKAGNLSEATIDGLRAIVTIWPAGFAAIALIFIFKYSLTMPVYDKLMGMVRDKEKGKEIDMEYVSKIL